MVHELLPRQVSSSWSTLWNFLTCAVARLTHVDPCPSTTIVSREVYQQIGFADGHELRDVSGRNPLKGPHKLGQNARTVLHQAGNCMLQGVFSIP